MKKLISLVGASTVLVAAFAVAVPALVSAKGPSPIMVGPVAISGAGDIGTCNNVWARDNYNKFYMLTANPDGSYNLKVDYRGGTFVTVNGESPGACESGTNNGNTVSAGITGHLLEEWNATVPDPGVPPILHPDCGAMNVDCSSAASFLSAVFASGHAAAENWTDWGYYWTALNGAWYDTVVGWPTNDRGDITGSPLPIGHS